VEDLEWRNGTMLMDLLDTRGREVFVGFGIIGAILGVRKK